MTTPSDVVSALADALRLALPGLKNIYLERIDTIEEPAVSIEIITFGQESFDFSGASKALTLDIIYFSEGNTVMEALAAQEVILSLILPGFWAGDRFLKPIGQPVGHLVEQDLHVTVTVPWMDGHLSNQLKPEDQGGSGELEETTDYPGNQGVIDYMEVLHMENKKEAD